MHPPLREQYTLKKETKTLIKVTFTYEDQKGITQTAEWQEKKHLCVGGPWNGQEVAMRFLDNPGYITYERHSGRPDGENSRQIYLHESMIDQWLNP